jgi:hypothetical protein
MYVKFNDNDVFLQAIVRLYFYIYFIEHEGRKKLKNKLKLGFPCT